MKIFSTEPNGNEAAELETFHYFNLAKKRLNEESNRIKETEKPIQVMLVHLDILIDLSKKYEVDANVVLKKAEIREWKDSFDSWFERCGKKIPAQFRDGIKESAETLFSEIAKFGH
jgi:hypothetical protein